MDIITYDELPDKQQWSVLQYQGFRWPTDYRAYEERRQRDPRLRNGPFGFCAVEKGKLLGFVGVMELPTRTVESVEPVGGIYGVVTDPISSRKGICTALMDTAHRYFRNHGYRFAMLTSSRGWVAYGLYLRLGYMDVGAVDRRPMATTLLDSHSDDPSGTESAQLPDLESLASLFHHFTGGRTGFAVRPQGFLSIMQEQGAIDAARSVLLDKGYALVSNRSGFSVVQEIVAEDSKTRQSLLEALEQRAGKGVVDHLVTTDALLEAYQKRNYAITRGRYQALMAKPLHPNLSLEETYGNDFYMSPIQSF